MSLSDYVAKWWYGTHEDYLGRWVNGTGKSVTVVKIRVWRMLPTGMWRRVGSVKTDISKEHVVYFCSFLRNVVTNKTYTVPQPGKLRVNKK